MTQAQAKPQARDAAPRVDHQPMGPPSQSGNNGFREGVGRNLVLWIHNPETDLRIELPYLCRITLALLVDGDDRPIVLYYEIAA